MPFERMKARSMDGAPGRWRLEPYTSQEDVDTYDGWEVWVDAVPGTGEATHMGDPPFEPKGD